MSLLLETFNTKKELKQDDADSLHSIGNLTGFNAIDIFSGDIEYDMYGLPHINGGIFPRAITLVGESTTGKTTLAILIAASIINRWNRLYGDLAELYFKDIEDNTPLRRIQKLTNWSDNEILSRVRYDNNPCSITDIFNEIRAIADLKEKYKDKLMVSTGLRDIDGSEIKVFSPTIYLVDSIAVLSASLDSFEFDKKGDLKDVESVDTNIDAAREAKANTSFIKKVKAYLSKYNIVLLMINHITEEMSMSRFDVPTRFLTFLKPGQKLKGGKELVYQSFAIINLSIKNRITDKEPIYGDAIRGSVNNLTFIKNKSNVEGISIPMVFDQKTGYRPELSDWEYLNMMNYGFSGSPIGYYLEILPEIKFTRKNLYETCIEKPILARALSFTAKFRMAYNAIFNNGIKTEIPSLQKIFGQMSYQQRLAYILSFTEPYPGYDNSYIFVSKNEQELAFNGQPFITSNIDVLGDSSTLLITEDIIEEIAPDEESEENPVKFYTFNGSNNATPLDEVERDDEFNYIFI